MQAGPGKSGESFSTSSDLPCNRLVRIGRRMVNVRRRFTKTTGYAYCGIPGCEHEQSALRAAVDEQKAVFRRCLGLPSVDRKAAECRFHGAG